MPELPEVETTRSGIEPHIRGRRIVGVEVRDHRLRWPVPNDLAARAIKRIVRAVGRRAKYLIVDFGADGLLVHLGMSGSLRLLPGPAPAQPHDHLDIQFDNGRILRFTDPRRFGCVLWLTRPFEAHPLLRSLGPEPLGDGFDGDHLYRRARGRRVAIKNFVMDGRVVVGVGNIYASEALFRARIRPGQPAGRISRERMRALATAIRQVLGAAIAEGGTTLRDFIASDGQPGYFSQRLNVYGRQGLPCPSCGTPIRCRRIGQRSTFYCARCQR
jgi:formamidopyrimidine-DNA glycosylase